MKREILSVAGAVGVIVILAVFLSNGVIVLSDVSAALAYVLVAALFGILLWGFGPRIKRIVRGENITMPIPSQKRTGRFPRLRRPPIRKEKRIEFWTTVISVEIIGVIAIYVFLSLFFSASLPPASTFNLLVMTIISVGAIISMMTLLAWLAINELYAMWESRKQLIANRKTTYLNLLEDFNKSFRGLKQTTQPKTKETMLAEFQYRLRNLCNLPWDAEVCNRITEVLEYIPEKLSDDPHVNYYLQFLGMIISFYGKYTITKIKEKFLIELENLYNTAKFDNILSMLQTLHGHSEEYIMKLVNDAGSTDQWNDSRFNSSMRNIEFWELRSRNQEAYNRILQYLRQKMDDAERNGDEKTHDRFKKLWESATRS